MCVLQRILSSPVHQHTVDDTSVLLLFQTHQELSLLLSSLEGWENFRTAVNRSHHQLYSPKVTTAREEDDP